MAPFLAVLGRPAVGAALALEELGAALDNAGIALEVVNTALDEGRTTDDEANLVEEVVTSALVDTT